MANGDGMSITHKNGSWHLDKRVQIADIVALLMIGIALAAWIFALSERVSTNTGRIGTHEQVMEVEVAKIQTQIDAHSERDRELMQEMNRHYQEILGRLSDQTRRLERIEDRVNQGG